MPILIRVKVHPGAKTDRIAILPSGAYAVWVRAPAEAGRANDAVLEVLSAELRLERKRLRIVKGTAGSSKIVQVLGS